jgi:hypothetical protein
MSRLALMAVVLTLMTVGCGSGNNAAQRPAPTSAGSTTGVAGPRQVTDLREIGQLRSLFNTGSGEPRLIVLVSPT